MERPSETEHRGLGFREGEVPSDKGGNQQRPLEEVGGTVGLVLERQMGIPSCLEGVGGRLWAAQQSQEAGTAELLWRASGAVVARPGDGGRVAGMGWHIVGVLDCY